ncbi:lyase family protein [Paenibacillus ehimensis]|uniref:argininosuccinate lyase n=1 Tax=Paenibacillus ehimensis TaxID=79264 RepID=A0ABT8V7C4_9BACL|nr:lyase family protein [Paenibacillus ehimensis]MDO3675621.1 lyase family protein [Paenibacillus ehimensis]
MVQKDEWLQAEGDCFPGKTYAEVVLEPAYEQAKAELLEPMLEVNKAHLLMLREQGLIRQEEAERIAAALEAVDLTKLRGGAYTGQFEDLFFQVEHELLQHAGEAAGNLHLARSRNDMGIAIYRLTLRKKLLEAIASALRLHDRLLRFAAEHTDTVMIGYTHTQQAQPTTMAHYAAAVSDSLGRDIRRLQAAYANCNRSSMGAAALTTSGFPISRERMAELLAFDGLIENAYDAVSGADYIGEIATAVQLAALNLGRFVQELLLWSTQEFVSRQLERVHLAVHRDADGDAFHDSGRRGVLLQRAEGHERLGADHDGSDRLRAAADSAVYDLSEADRPRHRAYRAQIGGSSQKLPHRSRQLADDLADLLGRQMKFLQRPLDQHHVQESRERFLPVQAVNFGRCIAPAAASADKQLIVAIADAAENKLPDFAVPALDVQDQRRGNAVPPGAEQQHEHRFCVRLPAVGMFPYAAHQPGQVIQ